MEITKGFTDGQIRLGLVTASLSLIVMYKLLFTKKSRLPPGPKGWPVIGNMYEMFNAPYIQDLFDGYRKQFGDLFTVNIGNEPIVILNSLETVREALVEKQNDYAGRVMNHSVDIISDGGKSIVSGDFNAIWKQQRKIAFSAIRQYATGQQLEDLIHNSFEKTAALIEKETGPVDPNRLISFMVYNIIFGMTCGENFELDDPNFIKLIDGIEDFNNSFGLGLAADFIPILKYIPTSGVRSLRGFNKTIKDYMKGRMDIHRKNYDPENLRNLCDTLIFYENEAKSEKGNQVIKQMDEYHFINILSDVVFAGTDTTRYTIMWVVLYMARNPESQKKMLQEIDDVLGNQSVTKDDRSKLHRVSAVLHETMRIKTLAPFSLPHTTTCDTTVGQYHIPKGTQVWPNLHRLNHDEKHWEDPHIYNENRFLDADGKFTGIQPSFKPFGTGRRICIGESLAKIEMTMLITMLFQRFRVSPPEGTVVLDAAVEKQPFCFPKPFQVVFTKRR